MRKLMLVVGLLAVLASPVSAECLPRVKAVLRGAVRVATLPVRVAVAPLAIVRDHREVRIQRHATHQASPAVAPLPRK